MATTRKVRVDRVVPTRGNMSDDATLTTETPAAPDPVKAEPVKAEAPKAEPAKADPAKAETPKAEPVVPTQAESNARVEAELAALKAQVAAAESARKDAETRERAAVEQSRMDFLAQFAGGLQSPEIARLAPSVTDADPRTEEGRAKLREWAGANPWAFRGAGAAQANQTETKAKLFTLPGLRRQIGGLLG